ncbi:MAG TPA: twin-arginine translocase TatA/TatE family subunit [Alphaproteobacteria bacterium]|jgi:sec-independent protein translocase protein TatA|nr:MAG: Sec-independent protein translocase protein TatA [Alphaproteobacteria bacterium MarineAlpha9_Bin6]PPR39108.1 MAG: Sec-independent protein translocase protein TatA [Alphaproteobacteria bacterium MarineAlpha9_Bin5]HHZ68145.1 twin-arginine translocase TatA/TatE family subunit [Alphaproteobacteria bacterium]HIA21200.1 twin-arginine translocase TatA/TatE family subunit [Alphaproteobacteria bacterium]HIB19654.1 twin-arginine translocase TatA/TatE family subunit [Alphaproteobacteria bacterium]
MGGIGVWQIVLILAIVLILFGAGKLPRVMGDIAKGVKSFKAGLKEEPEEQAVKEVPKAQARTETPSAESVTEPVPATGKQDEPANS